VIKNIFIGLHLCVLLQKFEYSLTHWCVTCYDFCVKWRRKNSRSRNSSSSSSSSIGTTTLVAFRPAQLSLSILSRKALQSAVASGTSNPQLGGEPGIFRAFQLSPQDAPSVWSDASEPSSGRWNNGREMAEKFCREWRLPRYFWVLLHAVKHDMGQTALLPLRRKACWRFFRPKNPTASAGFEPAN
jgi:hypothetical protein